MQLTVLGTSGSFPGPGGACSGYLIANGGSRILMDCGSGVLSRLQRICPIENLTAIVLSHLHADHMSDMLVLRYGLETRRAWGRRFAPLPLFMPQTPADVASSLDYRGVFAIQHIHPGMQCNAGPFTLDFTPMTHSVEAYAIGVQGGDRRLVYSGDTQDTHALVTAARDCDLLLCEASIHPDRAADGPAPSHLTPRQAADAASRAGARRLLLTHFWYEDDRSVSLAEARALYPEAALAEEMASYYV